MTIADKVRKSRGAGATDEEILEQVQKFNPDFSQGVKTSLEEGKTPSQILEGISAWDAKFGPGTDKSIIERITDPFRYGAASALQGGAATLTETGQEGTTSKVLASTSKSVAPSNYTPAHVTLNPSTWISGVPKAIAESGPGLAVDIAAGAAGAKLGAGLGALGGPIAPATVPIGAALGSVGGFIASNLARSYGNDARGSAIAGGGSNTSELQPEDKYRALAAGTVSGLASRFGLAGALGSPATQAAGSVASQALKALPRSMAVEGAANVAQEAAHQGLIQRKIDPEALGGALVTGAATGGAIKGAAALRDSNTARRTSDVDPESGNRFVQRVQAELGGTTPGETARLAKSDTAGFAAIRDAELKLKAERDLMLADRDTDIPGSGLKAQINDLPSEAALAHKVVVDTLKEGRVPKQTDMKLLEDTIGKHAEGNAYVQNLKDQQTFHQVKAMGNWDEKRGSFSGGIASNPKVADLLNPLGKSGGYISAGAGAYALLGGHTLPGLHAMHAIASPATALAVPAAQIGLYGALRGAGNLTGNSRPLNQMVQRFGSAPVAPSAPSVLPKYVSPHVNRASDAAAAERANAAATSSPVATQLMQANRVNAIKAQNARQETQRQDGLLRNVGAQSRMMANSDPSKTSVSDAVPHIKAAALAQSIAKLGEREAQAVAKADAKSLLATNKVLDKATRIQKKPEGPVVSTPAAKVSPDIGKRSDTRDIVTPWGTRPQPLPDVRNKFKNVEDGVFTRGQARADIVSTIKDLPLSPKGLEIVNSGRFEKFRDEVFNTSDRTRARGMLENILDDLSARDEQIIRDHLKRSIDPSTGHTFFGTYPGS